MLHSDSSLRVDGGVWFLPAAYNILGDLTKAIYHLQKFPRDENSIVGVRGNMGKKVKGDGSQIMPKRAKGR